MKILMDRALAIGIATFLIAIVFIYRVAMPYIVTHFGVLGVACWIVACYGLAVVFERR